MTGEGERGDEGHAIGAENRKEGGGREFLTTGREGREKIARYRFKITSADGRESYILNISDVEMAKLKFMISRYQKHVSDVGDVMREGAVTLFSKDKEQMFILENFYRLFGDNLSEADKQSYILKNRLQELSFPEFVLMLGIEDKENDENNVTLVVDVGQVAGGYLGSGNFSYKRGIFRIRVDQMHAVEGALSALGHVTERSTSQGGKEMKVIIGKGREQLTLSIRDLPGIYANVSDELVSSYGLDPKKELPDLKDLLDLIDAEQLSKARLAEKRILEASKPNGFLSGKSIVLLAEYLRSSDVELGSEMSNRYIYMTLSEGNDYGANEETLSAYAVPVSDYKNILDRFYSLTNSDIQRSSRETGLGMQYKVNLNNGTVLRLRTESYIPYNEEKEDSYEPNDIPNTEALRSRLNTFSS